MTTAEPFLLLFCADDAGALATQIDDACHDGAGAASSGRVIFARGARAGKGLRAAVLAGDRQAPARLKRLRDSLARPPGGTRVEPGIYLGDARRAARVGFLFPGQGVVGAAAVPDASVQRTIVGFSLVALRQMRLLGIAAELAVGHSLGELTALHWSGALDEPTLLHVADIRGRLMSEHDGDPGAMVAVHADIETCRKLIGESTLSVACRNGPRRHVLSGPSAAIEGLLQRAARAQVKAGRLRTTGAFHSPHMARAASRFGRFLRDVPVHAPRRTLLSTVTGGELHAETDLRALLTRQICDPVDFETPARTAAARSDLLIELGPGAALAHLVGELATTPVVSIRAELGSRSRIACGDRRGLCGWGGDAARSARSRGAAGGGLKRERLDRVLPQNRAFLRI